MLRTGNENVSRVSPLQNAYRDRTTPLTDFPKLNWLILLFTAAYMYYHVYLIYFFVELTLNTLINLPEFWTRKRDVT